MTQETTHAETHGSAGSGSSTGLYLIFTVTAAFVAAMASGLSLVLAIAPWAMFMGWIAYFTRKPSPAEGLRTYVCVVIGLSLGAISTLAVALLAPMLGALALPAVVFVTGSVVIVTRGLPWLNNLLGYFIGLVTFFAAHLEPTLATLSELAGATGLGSLAGWVAQIIESRTRRAVRA
ncbi:DUF1097 domain-containing protein [Ensifer sp. NPDC090286]|uniref:DUF1097 domain-containing protein n=1 Tax=Ensifer sp. NPDC090286 TaxID=3363991 RepID=UPI00383A6F51